MKTLSLTAGAVIACVLLGCASKPPAELRSARTAYTTAAQSPGAGFVASDLYEAKKSLDRAIERWTEVTEELEAIEKG